MTNGKITNNISELVGNYTIIKNCKPKFQFTRELIVKLEFFNPLSTVKDKIAVGMVD